MLLRKVAKNYDPASRGAALEYIRARHRNGEIVTGLLYIDEGDPDMHGINGTVAEPLRVKDGHVLVPDAPGIGLKWDEKAVKQYQM